MMEMVSFIKVSLLVGGILSVSLSTAQELYVFTEPASNMPSHSIGAKLNSRFGKETASERAVQRYIPELMFGINSRWMAHVTGSFSNMYTPQTRWESIRLYGKYRFLSNDEVHRHFRMAAFGSAVYSRNEQMFDELSDMGDQSVFSGGLVATQLVNKLAISSSAAYIAFIGDRKASSMHHPYPLQALGYSVSAGYLVFPLQYKNFRQTNLNIYLEFLGQRSLGMRKYYADLAPAAQLIFNSNTKLNIGYRFQLSGSMLRMMERGWLISLEHTFFNALRN